MPDKEYWEKRIAALQQEREQLIAMVNSVNGAIRECNLALEAESAKDREAIGVGKKPAATRKKK